MAGVSNCEMCLNYEYDEEYDEYDDEYDEDDDEEEIDSNLLIGEWVFEQFDYMPSRGDSFEYKNLLVTVASIEHNRLLKVRIDLRPVQEEGGDE